MPFELRALEARQRGIAGNRRQISRFSQSTVAPMATRPSMTDAAALEAAWSEGRAMSQAEAIAYALTRTGSSGTRGAPVSALGSIARGTGWTSGHDMGRAQGWSRQAQAMFAFLLDRGEHGVTKDEFIDVIWPDAELEQGDLNFHRTLGGLRTTLQPDKPGRSPDRVRQWPLSHEPRRRGLAGRRRIRTAASNAAQATDDIAAIRGLESARDLYRGDYLEDCPFYGDSEYVEERRRLLRGRLVDALVDLGRRYEARGDGTLAAARFREALTVSGDDCPSATDGLDRLGVPI